MLQGGNSFLVAGEITSDASIQAVTATLNNLQATGDLARFVAASLPAELGNALTFQPFAISDITVAAETASTTSTTAGPTPFSENKGGLAGLIVGIIVIVALAVGLGVGLNQDKINQPCAGCDNNGRIKYKGSEYRPNPVTMKREARNPANNLVYNNNNNNNTRFTNINEPTYDIIPYPESELPVPTNNISHSSISNPPTPDRTSPVFNPPTPERPNPWNPV